MLSRFRPRFLAIPLASLALTLAPPPAQACGGGMFTLPTETQTTFASGHRVAISISMDQTVLWDQIQYKGDPKDFGWVMPVKAGATIGVGSDAWLESLDAATATVVSSREVECFTDSPSSGVGCGASQGDAAGAGPTPLQETDPNVEVLHSATVGPYDTVTLASSTPGALGKWFAAHGYAIPADVQPILDDYAAQGFDFIAARLTPGMGVAQMKPLRVVTKGALTTFPMRMLAAGAKDSVALSLFVVTEGRGEIEGFPGAVITGADLTWNFTTHLSDYAEVRAKKLAANSGRTFLTSFAAQGALLSPAPIAEHPAEGPSELLPFATTFFARALDNKEVSAACTNDFTKLASSKAKVTGAPQSGETDASVFSCGKVDDLGVALTGLHPADVWVMRFEANLPRAALTTDLTIAPLAVAQTPVDSRLVAGKSLNDTCGALAPIATIDRPTRRPPREAALMALLLALGAAVARRVARTGRKRALVAPMLGR
jgi:hypothetical protein